MATFLEPAHAVSAALEMVDAVRDLASELEIKVGVHRGHSIAVTLNERLVSLLEGADVAVIAAEVKGIAESIQVYSVS